jgi:hypothetical protein
MSTIRNSEEHSKLRNFLTYLDSNLIVRRIGLAATALLLTIVTTIRNPAWYVTPPGQIDPWMYWGTGEMPEYVSEHFSLTYYFRRWTLIFPNMVFQNLFPPLDAQLALRGLILFTILILAGALAYKFSQSILTSVFVMILVSFSSTLMAGIGRTYHDGTGLVLFLTILILFERLLKNPKKEKLIAFGSGAVFGLLFVTYQFSLLVFVPFAIAIIFVPKGRVISSISKYIFPSILGFFTIDVLDFLIGLFFGYWPELLSFAISTGGGIQNSGDATLDFEGYYSLFLPPSNASFVLPLLLAGILLLLLSKPLEQRWFSWGLIGLASIYSLMPLFVAIGPQELHTSVYGIVAATIGISLAISRLLDTVLHRVRNSRVIAEFSRLLVYSTLIALSITWSDQIWLPLLGIAFASALVALLFFGLRGKSTNSTWGSVAAFISACLSSVVLFTQGLPYPAGTPSEQQMAFDKNTTRLVTLSQEVRALSDFALKNKSRIFLLDNRPHAGWSETISAFYGMFSSIAEGYPAPPVDCNRVAYVTTTPNPKIIVIHGGHASSTIEFLEGYLAPCNLVTPIFEGEVPGVEASVFRLDLKLGP